MWRLEPKHPRPMHGKGERLLWLLPVRRLLLATGVVLEEPIRLPEAKVVAVGKVTSGLRKQRQEVQAEPIRRHPFRLSAPVLLLV